MQNCEIEDSDPGIGEILISHYCHELEKCDAEEEFMQYLRDNDEDFMSIAASLLSCPVLSSAAMWEICEMLGQLPTESRLKRSDSIDLWKRRDIPCVYNELLRRQKTCGDGMKREEIRFVMEMDGPFDDLDVLWAENVWDCGWFADYLDSVDRHVPMREIGPVCGKHAAEQMEKWKFSIFRLEFMAENIDPEHPYFYHRERAIKFYFLQGICNKKRMMSRTLLKYMRIFNKRISLRDPARKKWLDAQEIYIGEMAEAAALCIGGPKDLGIVIGRYL